MLFEGHRTTVGAAAGLLVLALTAYASAQLLQAGQGGALVQWLSDTPRGWGVILFLLVFIVVSLPLAWGYMLANIGAGYVYGFWAGLCIVVVGAALGALIGTRLCQIFLAQWIDSKVNANETLRAVRRVMATPQSYRLVLLTRLTPIPFGLQNALFALTPVEQGPYVAYSALGLLPTQVLNTYVGTTFHRAEEVFAERDMNARAYVSYGIQCAAGMALMAAVFYKARAELHHVTRELSPPDIQLV